MSVHSIQIGGWGGGGGGVETNRLISSRMYVLLVGPIELSGKHYNKNLMNKIEYP